MTIEVDWGEKKDRGSKLVDDQNRDQSKLEDQSDPIEIEFVHKPIAD